MHPMLNRREFAIAVTGALAAGMSRPDEKAGEKPDEKSVYDGAFVLDCNSGPDLGETLPPAAQGLANARASGITAVKQTLGGATGGFEAAVSEIAWMIRAIELASDYLLQVRSIADLDRARAQRKLGIIFSFESAAMLGSDPARIDLFRNLGVLVMQLTYNRTTPFGTGCLDGETPGLTALGHDAVKRMNAQGVAIDVSHANTQTTAEAIASSAKPVVISHAGCRTVNPHPRNKEDREMRALAEHGGVMGIYMLPFLAPSPVQPTLDIYLKHMTHALDVCGEDHVGVGSDGPIDRFDDSPEGLAALQKDIDARKAAGVSAPGEDRPPYIPDLNGPRKIERIATALQARGYPARVVEKVIGGNFRRVFQEIWG
jgi:membrane dipeptidase